MKRKLFPLATPDRMKVPSPPENEQDRLKALESLALLDTPQEAAYDALTWLACEICQMPVSIINLLDRERQWFKSSQGLHIRETDRKFAFCNYTILRPGKIMIVPDCRIDERFKDNPLVLGPPHVVFYAGVPLLYEGKYAVGTLCVADRQPNALNQTQQEALVKLARQAVCLFELRTKSMQLQGLSNRNESLKNFAHKTAHDLKSPLSHISGISRILREGYDSQSKEEVTQQLNYLQHAADHLRKLIDDILRYSSNEELLGKENRWIDLSAFLHEIVGLLDFKKEFEIHYPEDAGKICTNRAALEQIILNLLSNALRHNDKEKVEVTFGFEQNQHCYEFYVQDNGPGIPEEVKERLFQPHIKLNDRDRFGEETTGIGLSTVQHLVEGLGGEINVDSKPNKGSRFQFSIRKPELI